MDPELFLMVHRQTTAEVERRAEHLRAARACPGCVACRHPAGVRRQVAVLAAVLRRSLATARTRGGHDASPVCCPA